MSVTHSKEKQGSNFHFLDVFLSQAGRTDRKEFVKKRSKLNPFASTSNKEKKRKKNFIMMKHSQDVRTKGKRSFRDKQVSLQLFHIFNNFRCNKLLCTSHSSSVCVVFVIDSDLPHSFPPQIALRDALLKKRKRK